MAEKEKKEEKKEEEKLEITILSRDFLTVFPKLREPHKLVHVTYLYDDYPPRTIEIDLFEIFKEEQEKAEKEIRAKSGDLAKKYFEIEKERIKEDLETLLKAKPETIEI